MKAKQKKLAREQLDATLGKFRPLISLFPPRKGWIRAIRDALGMTGEQLAKRLNVNKQRVARIERDEKLGKITIKTLRRVAEALDCKFVYCFVPKDSLEQTVRNKARDTALRRLARSNQMMRLEQQELNNKEKGEILKDLIVDITDTMPKSLWDEE